MSGCVVQVTETDGLGAVYGYVSPFQVGVLIIIGYMIAVHKSRRMSISGMERVFCTISGMGDSTILAGWVICSTFIASG